jgi:DNA polymerase I
MKIPLSVYPVDDGILVYRNGQIDKVAYPFKPFALVQKDSIPFIFGKEEVWRKIPEDENVTYIKLEFDNTKDLIDFKKRHSQNSNSILINQFIEQIYISQPDFFTQFPHTNELTIMFFDIEVASKGDGLFPKPTTNEILCIGYSIWKYANDGSKRKIAHKICKGFNITTLSDKIVIDDFLDDVQKYNPDILAGYFSDEFDLPFLIERSKIVGSDITKLCRGGREPIISDNKDNKVRIPGRIHFDIYSSNSGVKKDQTLFGIKSKTLKDLSRWYKIKRTMLNKENVWTEDEMNDIEIKEHMEDLLKLFKENPELLYAYQDDDIYRSEGVGNVYLRNCITLAEMMQVSLDNIVTMYSSFIPKLVVARAMEKERLINTETNFHKYNIQNGSVAKVSTKLKFEGAVVGLYRDGYIPATWKIDFASMYPSCIQTWNLGPDTTKLVRVEEYTGKYNCTIEGNYNWYRIPTKFDDDKYAYDFIVRVRNDKDGFLKKEIASLKKERVKIKHEMKAVTGDTKISLNSQQWAIKIILNSIYGFLGMKSTIYGDLTSATMVTSMCRWCTMKMLQNIKDIVIEADTDGYVIDSEVNAKEKTLWLAEEIHKKFNIKDNFMNLDLEGEGDRAYFYLMKNYVTEKTPGKYSIHGSSLKGSRSAKIVDRAISLGIEYIFNNKAIDEVIREAYNFIDLTLDDYLERAKMTKDKIAYSDMYDWRLFLARQVEEKTGQVLTAGAQINFVVTKRQLPFPCFKQYYRSGKNYTYTGYVSSVDELDEKYYIELIDKALAKFGISKNNYIKCDLFDTPLEKKPLDKDKPLDSIYLGEL